MAFPAKNIFRSSKRTRPEGIIPVIWFDVRSIRSGSLVFAIPERKSKGREPSKWLSLRYSSRRSGILLKGNTLPTRPFATLPVLVWFSRTMPLSRCNDKTWRLVRKFISTGSEPEKSFSPKPRTSMLERLPISEGIEPCKLL